MANEGGEWIMKGLDWDDPYRIRSWRELINWINEVGFLPLFANEVPGFSAEEHVSPLFWWTGDPEQDPWEWREIIPTTGEVAYGKFFNNKTGFISREWFPYSANAGGTDMISMRRGTMNWSSAGTRRLWISVKTAVCIRDLN